jgi:hypothetical protein
MRLMMDKNEGSHVKAAIILGAFILLSVCLGGICLIANTTLNRVLLNPDKKGRFSSECQVSEDLELPFIKGTNGVTTYNTYSGSVAVTVSGTGQAAGSAYNDAFYIFTNGDGENIPPEHPDEWILTINSNLAHSMIPNQQVPAYNSDHVYSFRIKAPAGVLVFGIKDGFAGDNTGTLSISLCQH